MAGAPVPIRVLHLALTLALFVPSAALAQGAAQQMLDMAKSLRTKVEKLRDSLPAETRAEMLKQADDIEDAVHDGAYGKIDAPATRVLADPDKNVAARLMAEHGRLDWLATKAACAGYTQENYSTFRYNRAINDRDSHCRNAYGHFSTYLRVTRAGEDPQFGEQALYYYYDAAAKRAVAHYGK